MELDRDHWEKLRQELLAPFPADQVKVHSHAGYPYLEEETIRRRLDEVCPGWECELRPVDNRDDGRAFVCAILIYGRRREDVGEWSRDATNADGRGMTDVSMAAATVAFKRCSQRWWVGNFLDYLPRDCRRGITARQVREAAEKAGWRGDPQAKADPPAANAQPPTPNAQPATPRVAAPPANPPAAPKGAAPQAREQIAQTMEARKLNPGLLVTGAELVCEGKAADGRAPCAKPISQAERDYSLEHYGKHLCRSCQAAAPRLPAAAGNGGRRG